MYNICFYLQNLRILNQVHMLKVLNVIVTMLQCYIFGFGRTVDWSEQNVIVKSKEKRIFLLRFSHFFVTLSPK